LNELDELAAQVALTTQIASSAPASCPQAGDADVSVSSPLQAEVQRLQEELAQSQEKLQSEEKRRASARLEADMALRSLEACQAKLAVSKEHVSHLERRIDEMRSDVPVAVAQHPAGGSPRKEEVVPSSIVARSQNCKEEGCADSGYATPIDDEKSPSAPELTHVAANDEKSLSAPELTHVAAALEKAQAWRQHVWCGEDAGGAPSMLDEENGLQYEPSCWTGEAGQAGAPPRRRAIV